MIKNVLEQLRPGFSILSADMLFAHNVCIFVVGLVPKFEGVPLPASIAPAPVSVPAVASFTAPAPASTPVAVQPTPTPAPTPVSAPAPTPAPAVSASAPIPSAADMTISEESKQHYKRVFASIDTDNDGFLTGAQAREVFTKSNLPVADLGLIWGLADVNKDGRLDFSEFSIAFFLIQWRLAAKELPPAVPASLFLSVGLAPPIPAAAAAVVAAPSPAPTPAPAPVVVVSTTPTINSAIAAAAGVLAANPTNVSAAPAPAPATTYSPSTATFSSGSSAFSDPSPSLMTPVASPAYSMTNPTPAPAMPASPMVAIPTSNAFSSASSLSGEWAVTEAQRETYRGYFAKALAQDPSGNGYVTAGTARTLLSRSGLPNTVLAKIWALSDADGDGKLAQDEFMVSMHLINLALAGTAMPDRLPDGLMASMRGSGVAAAMMAAAAPLLATNPAPAPVNITLTTVHVGPDPVQLAQQARMEEERREAERVRQSLLAYLRDKSQLIEQLRVMQQRSIQIGQQYIQADQAYLQQEENVREMELQIERMKIRGASIREKTVLAQQKLDALQDQKMQFDSLQLRRQQQVKTEQDAVQKLTEQVHQNRQAVDRVQQDNQNLRRQIEDVKKQRVLSQKVDADVLRAKLSVAASTPAAVNPVSPAPSNAAAQKNAFFDDFGTTQPFAARPASVLPEEPFVKMFAAENDAFGKFANPAPAAAAPVLPPKSQPAMPQPDDDFFTPAPSNSGIAVPVTPPVARRDSQAKFEIAGFSETPVSPDDDFFRGPAAAAAPKAGAVPVQFPVASDDFFSGPATSTTAPTAPTAPVVHAEPSDDFFTPSAQPQPAAAPAAAPVNPFPDAGSDFVSPSAAAAPAIGSGKMKNRSVADLFGGEGDDLFAGAVAPAKESNPFGASPAAPATDAKAAALFGGDDFFSAPPASASASGVVDDDDFFKPLSEEGKREGVPSEFDASAPAPGGFKPFDEDLF
jgi:hypothetical protein